LTNTCLALPSRVKIKDFKKINFETISIERMGGYSGLIVIPPNVQPETGLKRRNSESEELLIVRKRNSKN